MKKRVRIYKPEGVQENSMNMQNDLQSFIPKAQFGMSVDPQVQQAPQMQQPGMQQAPNQQEDISVKAKNAIYQELENGADPEEVYERLVQELKGMVEPQVINQWISEVVEYLNDQVKYNPEQDLAQQSMYDQEPVQQEPAPFEMPSGNQMMVNNMLNEDIDESYLYEDEPVYDDYTAEEQPQSDPYLDPNYAAVSESTNPFMKDGGLVSKKKFVSNVLKLAKKQMGNTVEKGKATITDDAENSRKSIHNNFMQGINNAAELSSVKANAEKQYEQLQEFACGGIKKYQYGEQVDPYNLSFRDKYIPFNRFRRPGFGNVWMGNARNVNTGDPYTGYINLRDDLVDTNITRRGIFSPTRWTNTYNAPYAGQRLENYETPELYRHSDGSLGYSKSNVSRALNTSMKDRITAQDTDQLTLEQQRDLIDAGHRIPDQSNIFQRMKWKMQQGAQGDNLKLKDIWHKIRQFPGAKKQKKAQWGLETGNQNPFTMDACPPGYVKGADGVCRNFAGYSEQMSLNPQTNLTNNAYDTDFGNSVDYDQLGESATLENPWLNTGQPGITGEKPSIRMGPDGEYVNEGLLTDHDKNNPDQVSVDFDKNKGRNWKSGLAKFNALAHTAIGVLEQKDNQEYENWFYNQLMPNEVTRTKDRGDWETNSGQWRPDQMGFTGVAQTGGQMLTEGEELYMSDQDIQDFINNGGELEYI